MQKVLLPGRFSPRRLRMEVEPLQRRQGIRDWRTPVVPPLFFVVVVLFFFFFVPFAGLRMNLVRCGERQKRLSLSDPSGCSWNLGLKTLTKTSEGLSFLKLHRRKVIAADLNLPVNLTSSTRMSVWCDPKCSHKKTTASQQKNWHCKIGLSRCKNKCLFAATVKWHTFTEMNNTIHTVMHWWQASSNYYQQLLCRNQSQCSSDCPQFYVLQLKFTFVAIEE